MGRISNTLGWIRNTLGWIRNTLGWIRFGSDPFENKDPQTLWDGSATLWDGSANTLGWFRHPIPIPPPFIPRNLFTFYLTVSKCHGSVPKCCGSIPKYYGSVQSVMDPFQSLAGLSNSVPKCCGSVQFRRKFDFVTGIIPDHFRHPKSFFRYQKLKIL